MSVDRFKKMVFSLLTIQPINYIVSRLLKLLQLKLPFYFPVKGDLNIRISSHTHFLMASDGRDSIASRVFIYGLDSFERESIELFDRLLAFDSVKSVFDIGANTGIYSLVASSHPKPLIVNAFEPMPDIYARLEKNIEANSFSQTTPHNTALSDNEGALEFFYMRAITVPTGGSAAKEDWPGVERISVTATTIDNFVVANQLDSVDLIKIDTEMTEPAVLSGGLDVIKEYQPFIICEVLDEKSSVALQSLLQPLGYRFFHITSSALIEKLEISHDISYEFANYLFVGPLRYDEFARLELEK